MLAFVYLNPGSTLGDVRAGTGVVGSLAVLRQLRRRGDVRKVKRLWRVTTGAVELMAMGSRLAREGLQAFRLPKGGGNG
ncbi:hypothetical protein F0U59_26805 [Archangium gephyra]|nr:hypothetical protein F0U59_26805 [Archangium gephyra]